MSDIRICKELAISMAKEVGAELREAFGTDFEIKFKGEKDIVTEMDLRAEKIIIDSVKARFPDHGILSEECDEIKTESGKRWIIDPIDGTTNYAHNLPHFCVSIAYEEDGVIQVGVIYHPILDELFWSVRGEGSYCEGSCGSTKRLKVSIKDKVGKSLIATDLPYDFRDSTDEILKHYHDFCLRGQSIRRLGSAALDFCYVASGRLDGFWLVRLKPWDVAAAGLIAEEAGATITDFSGTPYNINSKSFVVSNGLIHDEMLEVLKDASLKR